MENLRAEVNHIHVPTGLLHYKEITHVDGGANLYYTYDIMLVYTVYARKRIDIRSDASLGNRIW